MSKTADRIRRFGQEKYVQPARSRKARRFSIRSGDVVRELGLLGRVPAVCSALKSRSFLELNGLRLVESTGPKSGQSTTVVYTYEFIEGSPPESDESGRDAWTELRGSLKGVFADLGGGETYLRNERKQFQADREET